MTKREEGFRFIYRGAVFMWVHPATVRPKDIDCTDMDDCQFAKFCASLDANRAGKKEN